MSDGIVIRRLAPAAYAAMAEAFDELALRSDEPNLHMSPAAASAAALLVPEGELVVLTAWRSEALGVERLLGIWLLRRRRDWTTGFEPVLQSPPIPLYEVSSLPVVDRDAAEPVLRGFLRHLAGGGMPRTLGLPLLPEDGAVAVALREACRSSASPVAIIHRWQRPIFLHRPGEAAEGYLRRSLGSGFKKRMQQDRQLARAGTLAFVRLRGAAALEGFERFLALEASGWKGRAGTAIAGLPRDLAYFRRLTRLLAERDALQVDELTLDGEPVAIGIVLASPGRRLRQFLKIAYAEGAGRRSPGRALTIAMLRKDFAEGPAALFDSGAGDAVDAGTYPWAERRPMTEAFIRLSGRGSPIPAALRHAVLIARRIRARIAARRAGRQVPDAAEGAKASGTPT